MNVKIEVEKVKVVEGRGNLRAFADRVPG